MLKLNGLGRVWRSEGRDLRAPSIVMFIFVFYGVFIHNVSIYVNPKRKFSPNTSSSSQEASPEEKRAKESYSPDVKTSGDEGEVMAPLKLSEGVTKKLDLILARLNSLDSRMEELNSTVKGLQSKISSMEIDIDSVKDKQKGLDEKFTHMENNNFQIYG